METYLYKTLTQEKSNLFKNELNLGDIEYDIILTNHIWFIIYCTIEQAQVLKDKGFEVTLDDMLLTH